jgi:hypothetical protein
MDDPDKIFEAQKKVLEEAVNNLPPPPEPSPEDQEDESLKLSKSVLVLTELSDFARQITAASRFCVRNGRNDLAMEFLKTYIDEFDRVFEGYYTGVEDKEFIDAIAQRYGLDDETTPINNGEN